MTFAYKAAVLLIISSGLAACGQRSSCGDADVLPTIKRLFIQKELGPFMQLPANIFIFQDGSATLTSIDKPSGIQMCSVVVRIDYLAIARLVNPMSDDDYKKIQQKAVDLGQPLIQEKLVSYQVQPLASGQRYITVLNF